MKYCKFIIDDYRAITGTLEIDVEKNRLIPIIGVNECGKTTILHAIFAFDFNNDKLNNGRHIEDFYNLYNLDPKVSKISALVDISPDEVLALIKRIERKHPSISDTAIRAYKRNRKEIPSPLKITRNLKTKRYSINFEGFKDEELSNQLAQYIIAKLPFILFFDDFRDSVDDRIEIIDPARSTSSWLPIFEALFKKTDVSFSIFDLPQKEPRQRKSILAKVMRRLNDTLTKEWQNFRLDDSDALSISIEFEEEQVPEGVPRFFLKFDVVETDAAGDQHYFFIGDRSKGFFWFFNFVMKLEFNPKVARNSNVDAIYLLDEPGSYLHASAQSKLTAKLRNLSTTNVVIYCTHSHHLLDPDIIPINKINIAEKDDMGKVSLFPIHDHKGRITEKRSAYQPLLDALQIRPLSLDFGHEPVLITEGIIDYYLVEIFKEDQQFTVLPSVGADSIKFYISLMIAWRIDYNALWDYDDAGRDAYADASDYFGQIEAEDNFRYLPLSGRQRKKIMQDMITGNDLSLVKDKLGLPKNSSFTKTIAAWFYSPDRQIILKKLSKETKAGFESLFNSLSIV